MKHLLLYENYITEAVDAPKPKKKLMKDMNFDEKIAVYRSRITKERAKKEPSTSKIDALNALISNINSKKINK